MYNYVHDSIENRVRSIACRIMSKVVHMHICFNIIKKFKFGPSNVDKSWSMACTFMTCEEQLCIFGLGDKGVTID